LPCVTNEHVLTLILGLAEALGAQHSLLLPDLVHDMSIEASLHPETFFCFCLLPNTPGYGQGGQGAHRDKTLIAAAQVAVLEKFRESVNQLEVEEIMISYDPATMWSPWRQYRTSGLVAYSNQRDTEGKLLSRLAACQLVTRGTVPGLIAAMPRKDFRNWVADASPALDGNSDISAELRQHHSGIDLWRGVLKSILDGQPPTMSVAVRDWTPVDDTLPTAIMNLNRPPRSLPRLSYSGTVWENFIRTGGGLRLKENLQQAVYNNLAALATNGGYTFPGLPGLKPPSTTNSMEKPALKLDYDLCAVSGSGNKNLAIRQVKLSEWEKTLPLVKELLGAHVAEHNRQVNPDGVPYKANSRPRDPIQPQEDLKGKRLPPLENQAADYQALSASGTLSEVQAVNN
jgi:hypothetical protein